MAEKVVYTVPPTAQAPTEARVVYIENGRAPWFFHCITVDQMNAPLDHYYREADGAEVLIKALNKANLSTKSMERRILEKLLADGKLAAGTIEGSPD